MSTNSHQFPPHLANTHTTNTLPFVERDGLLMYQQECKTPEFFARSSFVIMLLGERVVVDHFVVMFPALEALSDYAEALVECGAQIIEGPGTWPDDFCPKDDLFSEDFSMYFLSALMPSGGIIVLSAPHAPNDALDRLLQTRGLDAVHHVGIRVDDVHAAKEAWENKGFIPLSEVPIDDGSLCQWFLVNRTGQIVELICRKQGSLYTFSCKNMRALRLCEKEAKRTLFSSN
jgi:hypothetical protein